MSTEEQREIGDKIFFSKCSEELKKWWTEYRFLKFFPTTDRFSTDSLGAGFKDAQWVLMLFAVDPAYHRKGVAKALMKVIEEKAKASGTSIVVETTTELNLLIYKRMGFNVKGKITLVSPVGQSPVWQLMKTPKV
ncbi:hypothetical protein DXG01_015040 [Tephrocybe rancida]|nr:hypothetical protein DXG01_015040 [Tephrocybe rancida]